MSFGKSLVKTLKNGFILFVKDILNGREWSTSGKVSKLLLSEAIVYQFDSQLWKHICIPCFFIISGTDPDAVDGLSKFFSCKYQNHCINN